MKSTYVSVAAMIIMTSSLLACTADTEEEEQGTSVSSLGACRPTAKVGTQEWRDQLKACIAERTSGSNGGTKSGEGTAGKEGTSSSSSRGCRVSISCNGNEGCHCTTPGLPPTPCSGGTCGEVCKVCN